VKRIPTLLWSQFRTPVKSRFRAIVIEFLGLESFTHVKQLLPAHVTAPETRRRARRL
jgi:hypothetical protein